MRHPRVKARVALVVVELEGDVFEVSTAASGVISQALVAAFTAHDDGDDEPDLDDDEPEPGEVKQ